MQIDADIAAMKPEDLRQRLQEARNAIRHDWQCSGHELCWFKPELWKHDPEYVKASPEVPPTCEFLGRCTEYRKSLGE